MERQAFDAIPLGPETWVPRDDPKRLARDSYECQREAQALGAPALTPLLNALEGRMSTREMYKECIQVRGYRQAE
jgi:hypothetical protein